MYCENCGMSIPDGATVCDICGQSVVPDTNVVTDSSSTPDYTSSNAVEQETTLYSAQSSDTQKRENMFLGIIGAILGALLGGASIILFSQLGYVASISGVILAFCTVKGYELLGRSLSKRGAVICILLILVTPYLADRLDWAIMILKAYKEYGATIYTSFLAVPDFLAEGIIDKSIYIKGLLMVYLFAALGAIGSLKDLFSK